MCIRCKFMFACSNGMFYMVKKLLQHVDINHKNKNNQTGMMLASYKGYSDIVEFLLEKKGDFTITDNFNNNTMTLACRNGHLQCVKLLYRYNRKFWSDRNGHRTMLLAIESGNFNLVKFLIQNGVPLDYSFIKSETPLMVASKLGNFSIVNLLVRKGADRNVKLSGKTAADISSSIDIKIYLNN